MHKRLTQQEAADRGRRRDMPMPPSTPEPWPSIPPNRIWWCLLIGATVHLALWQISEPHTLFSDFYKAYYPAGEVLWENGIHTSFPFTEAGAGGFVNLPIVGLVFVPLVPLGEELAGWAFLALGAVATLLAYVVLKRMVRAEADVGTALMLLFLLNGPLINSLREGNTTHFVLLLLVVALLLLQRGAEFAAGLLLGLCAVIKLPLLLYAVYFLLRRRWVVVAGGASTICAAAALSIVAFGMANNVSWFTCCIEPFLGGIIPAFNVQSIDGFAIRLTTGTSMLADWEPMEPPAAYRIARMFIFAAILGGAFMVAWRSSRNEAALPGQSRMREALEYSLVLTLALIVSPISWSHYYLLLLLPWGLHLGRQLPLAADPLAHRLTVASIVLASLPVIVLPLQADLLGETLARTLVSAHLFGGVAMLGALLRALYVLGGPPPHASAQAQI